MSKSNRQSVIASALWAAAGDALGWITELGDVDTVRHRTGETTIDRPLDWKRRIGGRFGPTVPLPAGTYSDDTQLRLAVCRATRGDGEFDAEAFAKIELPVWTSYSLGGGRGTTAAATNLSKSSATWFSNFFGGKGERGYFEAGGNGAAMRVQPHVWKIGQGRPDRFVADVMRDAIITHGHPQGFCGAVFHAFCVYFALNEQRVPSPDDLIDFSRQLDAIALAVQLDEKLSVFWVKSWEEKTGISLKDAVRYQAGNTIDNITQIKDILSSRKDNYRNVLKVIGGFAAESRGAGIDTAVSAAMLSFLYRDEPHETMLAAGANAIGSDTDTIASMAGAISGAARPDRMAWIVQDAEYIASEAERIHDISTGKNSASFSYPDLLSWSPPSSQADAIGEYNGNVAIKGLGRVDQIGMPWSTSEASWQWYKTEFGQTILAKRRANLKKLSKEDMPVDAFEREKLANEQAEVQSSFFEDNRQSRNVTVGASRERAPINSAVLSENNTAKVNVDALIERVISSDFDPNIIGRAFIRIASSENCVENSIAFSAVISKAINARRRRRSN